MFLSYRMASPNSEEGQQIGFVLKEYLISARFSEKKANRDNVGELSKAKSDKSLGQKHGLENIHASSGSNGSAAISRQR